MQKSYLKKCSMSHVMVNAKGLAGDFNEDNISKNVVNINSSDLSAIIELVIIKHSTNLTQFGVLPEICEKITTDPSIFSNAIQYSETVMKTDKKMFKWDRELDRSYMLKPVMKPTKLEKIYDPIQYSIRSKLDLTEPGMPSKGNKETLSYDCSANKSSSKSESNRHVVMHPNLVQGFKLSSTYFRKCHCDPSAGLEDSSECCSPEHPTIVPVHSSGLSVLDHVQIVTLHSSILPNETYPYEHHLFTLDTHYTCSLIEPVKFVKVRKKRLKSMVKSDIKVTRYFPEIAATKPVSLPVHSSSDVVKCKKKPVNVISIGETVICDLSKRECETLTIDCDQDSSVIILGYHSLLDYENLSSKRESKTISFACNGNRLVFERRFWIHVPFQAVPNLTREIKTIVTVRIKSHSGSQLLMQNKPLVVIDHKETVLRLGDLNCDLLLSKNKNEATTINNDEDISVRMSKDKKHCYFLFLKCNIDCKVGSDIIHGNTDKDPTTFFPEVTQTKYVTLTMASALKVVKQVPVLGHEKTVLCDLRICDLLLSKEECETLTVDSDQDNSVILASHSLIKCEDLPTKSETIAFNSSEDKLVFILKERGFWIHLPLQILPDLPRETRPVETVSMKQQESNVKSFKQLTTCFPYITKRKCVSHSSSELLKRNMSVLVIDHTESVASDLKCNFSFSKVENEIFDYNKGSISILEHNGLIDIFPSKTESETISFKLNENGSVSTDLTGMSRPFFVKVKKKRQESNVKSETKLTTFFSMTGIKYELQLVYSNSEFVKCKMAVLLPDCREKLLSDLKWELKKESDKHAFHSYEDRFREQKSLQISLESAWKDLALFYAHEQRPKLCSSNLSLPNYIGIVSSCSTHHGHSDYNQGTKCRTIKSFRQLPEPVTVLVSSTRRCDLLSSTKGYNHELKNNYLLSSEKTSDLSPSKETGDSPSLNNGSNFIGEGSIFISTSNEINKEFVMPNSVQVSSDFLKSCYCTKPKHAFVSTSRPFSFLTSCISVLLLSLLVLIQPQGMLAFSEVPLSQTVSAGDETEFTCQYMGAFSIVWTVNGSQNYPPGVSSEPRQNGEVIDSILTITALPEYNGTHVQCVATIINGTSPTLYFSPSAVLLVISNTPSPTTSPPTVTLTTTSPSVFLAIPSSQNVTAGTTVFFYCEHETGLIFWRINDSRVGEFSAASIRSNTTFHTLTIAEPSLEYNGTKVECIAIVDSEQIKSPPATLLLQGQLDAVTNVSRDSSIISWNPPPSLDLTNVEPDVVYCVDVYNITCGGRKFLLSDCEVTKTSYTSLFLQSGYIYEYTVTPRSNVEGAQNGTSSQPVRDNLPSLSISSSQVSMIDYSTVKYRGLFTLNDTNLPVPSSFTLSLVSLDEVGEKDMAPIETNTTMIAQKFVTLDVPELDRHRLWNCLIKPYYRCLNSQNPVLSEEKLSTHDIQNISFDPSQPGEVRVTGDFINGSTATGLLAIVISTSEIYYDFIERGSDLIHIEGVLGVVGGEYNISLFVVEKSGLPFNRTASVSESVSVDHGNDANLIQPSIEYSLQSTSTGVCITCTFLDNNATDCVAVVHQRISQLSSSGLMNINSSHKLIRSEPDDTASGCIEVLNMDDFQTGVVDGRLVIIPQSSNVCNDKCIIAVSGVVIFCLLAVVIILIVIVSKKNKTIGTSVSHSRPLENSNSELGIYHQKNVYEDYTTTECTSETTLLRVESDSRARLLRVESYGRAGHRRVEFDGRAGLMRVESDGDNHQICEPPMHVFLEQEPELKYAKPDFIKKSISTPPLDNNVKYANVKNFKNPQGQHYAMVDLKSSNTQNVPDNKHKTTSQYSKIQHRQHVVVHKGNVAENKTKMGECPSQCGITPSTLYTVENLLPFLRPICSKWKDLGMVMLLDDDYLDQVFTNNEGDEACLQDLLERYMDNSDFKHSWEEIVNFLQMMGENSRANDIYKLHVYPYLGSLPGQTHEVSDLTRNVKELPSESPQSHYEKCDSITEKGIATDEIKSENNFQIDDMGCLAHSELHSHDEPLPTSDELDSMTDLSLPVDETFTPKSNINPRRDEEVKCHLCDQKDETKEISEQFLQSHDEPIYTEKDMVKITKSKNPIPVPDDLRDSLATFLSEVVVLLHTVKEEETIATLNHLSPPVEQSDKPIRWLHANVSVILGIFGDHKAALVTTSKGTDCQPELVAALRSLPNAKLIIALGFACGLNSRCKLGDVLVSTSIDGIGNVRLEHGKVKFDEGHAPHISMSICSLNVFTKGTSLWRKFICSTQGRQAKVVAGPLISSPELLNNKAAFNELLKKNECFKGGEMEGQEVARAQLTLKEEDKRDVDFIIIKGVADFGDGSKEKNWQLTATLAAANYAEEKLRESGGRAYNLALMKYDIEVSGGKKVSYPSDVNDESIENASYLSSPDWKLDGQNNEESIDGSTERYADDDEYYSENFIEYLWSQDKSGKKSQTVSFINDMYYDPCEGNLIELYNNLERNTDDDVGKLFSSQSTVTTEGRCEFVFPHFRSNAMSFYEETLSDECKKCFVSTKGLILSANLHPQPQRRFYLDQRHVINELTCYDVDSVSGPIDEDTGTIMSPMQKEEVQKFEHITCNIVDVCIITSDFCDVLTWWDVDTVSEPLDEDICGISPMEDQYVEDLSSFTWSSNRALKCNVIASKWKTTNTKNATNEYIPEYSKSSKQVRGNKGKMKRLCLWPKSLMMASMCMTTKISQPECPKLSKEEKGNRPNMKFVQCCERNLAPTYLISSRRVKDTETEMKSVFKCPRNLLTESSAEVTSFTEALQKLNREKEAVLDIISVKHTRIKCSSIVDMKMLQQQCSDDNALLSKLSHASCKLISMSVEMQYGADVLGIIIFSELKHK